MTKTAAPDFDAAAQYYPADGPPIEWIFTGEWQALDNFYQRPIDVYIEGIGAYVLANSVESAFQASKTLQPLTAMEIAKMSPGAAKSEGRRVSLRHDWEIAKFGIMHRLVMAKFTQHEDLWRKLDSTGDRLIIEGNTWDDTTWGVVDGKGLNWLGQILMHVRTTLRQGGAHAIDFRYGNRT